MEAGQSRRAGTHKARPENSEVRLSSGDAQSSTHSTSASLLGDLGGPPRIPQCPGTSLYCWFPSPLALSSEAPQNTPPQPIPLGLTQTDPGGSCPRGSPSRKFPGANSVTQSDDSPWRRWQGQCPLGESQWADWNKQIGGKSPSPAPTQAPEAQMPPTTTIFSVGAGARLTRLPMERGEGVPQTKSHTASRVDRGCQIQADGGSRDPVQEGEGLGGGVPSCPPAVPKRVLPAH